MFRQFGMVEDTIGDEYTIKHMKRRDDAKKGIKMVTIQGICALFQNLRAIGVREHPLWHS